jgi:hypothetical protein
LGKGIRVFLFGTVAGSLAEVWVIETWLRWETLT